MSNDETSPVHIECSYINEAKGRVDFDFIKDWVEKKVRRHLMRARNRRGFGWKRWSRRWLYEELELFNNYRVRRLSRTPKALLAR